MYYSSYQFWWISESLGAAIQSHTAPFFKKDRMTHIRDAANPGLVTLSSVRMENMFVWSSIMSWSGRTQSGDKWRDPSSHCDHQCTPKSWTLRWQIVRNLPNHVWNWKYPCPFQLSIAFFAVKFHVMLIFPMQWNGVQRHPATLLSATD